MITRDDIKRLLLERKLYASISDDIGYDSEIALDSLSLIWFLHALEQEHGIKLSLEDGDYNEFTSINKIFRCINQKVPRTTPEMQGDA